MKNLKNKLCDQIKSLEGCPFTRISTDIFILDGDEVLCRYEPSRGNERQFIGGGKKTIQELGFYCRSKNSDTARNWLQWIADNVDMKDFFGEGIQIYCGVSSLPQFVSVDEQGFTAYSMTINATFYEE